MNETQIKIQNSSFDYYLLWFHTTQNLAFSHYCFIELEEGKET